MDIGKCQSRCWSHEGKRWFQEVPDVSRRCRSGRGAGRGRHFPSSVWIPSDVRDCQLCCPTDARSIRRDSCSCRQCTRSLLSRRLRAAPLPPTSCAQSNINCSTAWVTAKGHNKETRLSRNTCALGESSRHPCVSSSAFRVLPRERFGRNPPQLEELEIHQE